MLPLYVEPWYTFRFADDRLIPRFHLEGVEAGRQVSVFRIDPGTGERLGLLATVTVGEGGWVDLIEPITVRAGEAFVAVPEAALRVGLVSLATICRESIGSGPEKRTLCTRRVPFEAFGLQAPSAPRG